MISDEASEKLTWWGLLIILIGGGLALWIYFIVVTSGNMRIVTIIAGIMVTVAVMIYILLFGDYVKDWREGK